MELDNLSARNITLALERIAVVVVHACHTVSIEMFSLKPNYNLVLTRSSWRISFGKKIACSCD